MNMFKRFLSVFCSVAILSTSVSLTSFAEFDENTGSNDFTPMLGYQEHEFVDIDGNIIEPQLIPAKNDLLTVDFASDVNASYYNLVDEGRVPAIRNQNPLGTCWAHAALVSAETNMIIKGYENTSVDYSEAHLVWFANGDNSSNDTSDPTYGDCNRDLGTDCYNNGGNGWDAMYALSKWSGAQLETNAPYSIATSFSGVDDSQRYDSYAHLEEVLMYDESDISAIKNAVVKNGAVMIAYYYDEAYESADMTYYNCDTNLGVNHAVAIVGWDDNCSRTNFNANHRPSSNGAWIVRNSWGSWYGDDGYFYLSYEDATFSSPMSFLMGKADNYEKIYQYDGCGGAYGYYSGEYAGANIFTAEANDTISAVGFYTVNASVPYTVDVYTGVTAGKPNSGTLACTTSGTITYAGYHTVKLPKTVSVTKGQKFSVVVTYKGTGTNYVMVDNYNTTSGISFTSTSGGASWFDTVNWDCNVCIKAYTAAATVEAPTNLKATPANGSVKLTWNKVNGATKYLVYKYVDGVYTTLTDTLTTNSYTATGLTNGTKYGFKVKAYGGKWSAASDIVYATPVNPIPTGLQATAANGSVKLTWTAVSGATKYIVYKYVDGEYTTLTDTLTTNSYTATGLTNGTKYGFKVKAYVNSAWSGASEMVYATPVNPIPTGVKAVAGDASVAVSWTKVSGATKYAVYLYEYGEYTTLTNSVTSNTYTATGLTNNKKVGFKVKAYVNSAWSGASELVYATPSATAIIPANLKIANGNGKVQVTWDKVTGATKYAVYSYLDSVYTTETSSATANSYTVSGLTNGTKYGFKVKAYVNGKWSAASSIIYARPSASTAPGAIKAIAANKSAEVKWSGVIGATKYAVYKYEDGVYTCIKSNITDTSYTVTGLTNGTKYGFKVKAYVDGAWSAASVIAYATPNA